MSSTPPTPSTPIIPAAFNFPEDPLFFFPTTAVMSAVERRRLRSGPNRRVVTNHPLRHSLVETADKNDKMTVRELVASLSRATGAGVRAQRDLTLLPADEYTLPSREPSLPPTPRAVRPIPLKEVTLPMDLLRQLDDESEIGSPLHRHFPYTSANANETVKYVTNDSFDVVLIPSGTTEVIEHSEPDNVNPFGDGNPFTDKNEIENQITHKASSRFRLDRRGVTRFAANLSLRLKPTKRTMSGKKWYRRKGTNKVPDHTYHGTI